MYKSLNRYIIIKGVVFIIRLAVYDDLHDIMKVVSETIDLMVLDSNTQWDRNYPLHQNFKSDIDNSSLYVIEKSKSLGGFICINNEEPKEYIKMPWSNNNKFLVIHRMAVSVKYRSNGIGTELLSYAETLAKDKRIHLIKSDTYSLNPKMNCLFQKCGYKKIGEMNFLNKPHKFNCYEKSLY